MKKIKIAIFLLIFSFAFVGCTSTAVNEIHNKSYDVTISLTEFEDLVVAAIEKAAPAVIGVSNYQRALGSVQMELAATGSGVIYECKAKMKDATIEDDCSLTMDSDQVDTYVYTAATNRHVIEDSDALKVYIGEERLKIEAVLLGADDKVDLAVLQFEHYKYIQPLEFADSDAIAKGSFAIAIGNPSGYEYYGSATFGIVSYPKRYLADDTDGDSVADWEAEYIQHDVAINPGNSGGALINTEGKLLGINTLKMISEDIDNMGFAIPSNVVAYTVPYLETGGTPVRRTLGITIIDLFVILNPEDYADTYVLLANTIPEGVTNGLYVDDVDLEKLAAGLLFEGDVIVSINDVDILYAYEFRKELNLTPDGGSVILGVYRDQVLIDVTITF